MLVLSDLDAIALNIGRSEWQRTQVDRAYAAAQRLGTGLKLFLSFDFTEMDCHLAEFVDRVKRYKDHPNQFKVNGKPMVSSYEDCLGNAGWARLKAQTDAYVMPFISGIEGRFHEWPALDTWYCWGCAWPQNNHPKDTDDDNYYLSQLGSRYATTVSMWMYTHYNYKKKNKRLCADQGIQGFPTVKLFPRGDKLPPMVYQEGERTASGFFYFATRRVPKHVDKFSYFDDIPGWSAESFDFDCLQKTFDSRCLDYWLEYPEDKTDADAVFEEREEKESGAIASGSKTTAETRPNATNGNGKRCWMKLQKMKPRHLQMFAVGGSIGTGLFVGSGSALRVGGPAGILVAWLLIGVMLINVTQTIGEMSILYHVPGGFYTLPVRFLGPSFAFAMGQWNYVFQWVIVLPLEITVASTTVQYWGEDIIPIAGWITIFWIVITIVCVFGTLSFAEEEFWSSVIKLLVVVMFIFIGIICICEGGPSVGEYTECIGGRYWSDPGAFANGFKGVCAVFITAAFSFAGTELVGLATSETPNPRATMPATVKTFWRITLIYVTSLTIIGLLLIPYNHPRLLGAPESEGLNHIVNITICISVLSIGISCVYAGSRTLTALAETGYAPKFCDGADKSSRPLYSVIVILLFGALVYVNVGAEALMEEQSVMDWLLALSGHRLSTLFTWLSICLCHIRFRHAWQVQGHSVEELPFQALGGAYGSWFGVILIVLVLIAQFYIAIWPIGGTAGMTGGEIAEGFFKVYLALPVMVLFYIIGYAWKRTLPQRAHEIDLDTGRKSWLTVEEMRQYRAERRNAPLHIRIYRILFTNSA
ncbi:hypothetical protein CVT24_001478 [Panaeolus cyanescens]|uniref:Amino acid permease/ SLC12A domain-containing protein n=1 Tax=Panaeolus cyanescens TaxID=181874 RepID=A0A409VT85_9AGAR|nr:hypothetical protein CVT24_001478 [Panaeolus cyanescens]